MLKVEEIWHLPVSGEKTFFSHFQSMNKNRQAHSGFESLQQTGK